MLPTVGRPKGPPTEKVGARIKLTEKAVWQRAAELDGASLSAFVVRAVRLEVGRVLGDQSVPPLPKPRARKKA